MFLLLGSFHLIVWALCLVLVLLCILSFISIFAIILTKNRELIAFFQLSSVCLVTVRVMLLFLAVPLVGLQCVIVVFPDHGKLLVYRSEIVMNMHTFQLHTSAFWRQKCIITIHDFNKITKNTHVCFSFYNNYYVTCNLCDICLSESWPLYNKCF